MNVKIKFRRALGKATASIDCAELHTYLTELGVQRDTGGRFVDPPFAEYPEVDPNTPSISTGVLLRGEGVVELDLNHHFHRPVDGDVLSQLADSLGTTVRAVVDHYRPIEISVIVAGKKAA